MMEVILLEKIRNLGDIGSNVSVKPGYARNYLIPYGKAVVASKDNLEKFAKMRAELEESAAMALKEATERKEKIENSTVSIVAQATEEGKLFGSIGISTILKALHDAGLDVKKNEINLSQGPIRQLGEHEITLLLHADVTAIIKLNIVATTAN